MRKLSELSKREKEIIVNNIFYILIGNFLLAFGTAIFLTTLGIVAGGLSGIGIIIQHYVGKEQMIDIFVMGTTWALWVVGLIFLGKDFALKTLGSAIIYPLALILFMRIECFQELSEKIAYYGVSAADIILIKNGELSKPIGNLLICGLFSGVFVGSGVALNFKGGGSSGGVDVIIALLAKCVGLKESISSFLIDGAIILVAMFAIPDNVVPALIGILSAFITSLMIEIIYVSTQSSYQVDIISEKWQEISDYAQDTLGRGTTIISAKGGYKGDDRPILRIVFPKSQFNKIKNYISRVDDKAFVTFTITQAVYGEGFKRIFKKKERK